MAETDAISGNIIQHDTPNWELLVDLLGRDLAAWFMWMFEIELIDGSRLHAYKHVTTRRYLHLDTTGQAFHYDDTGRYQVIAVPIAIARVFVGWDLGSPGGKTATALRAAMYRAREAS